MTKKQQLTQDKIESKVVETMKQAREIAMRTFGVAYTVAATEEVYEYLELGVDVAEFVSDLQRIHGHATKVHDTLAPTPEMVFGLFNACYPDESDEE